MKFVCRFLLTIAAFAAGGSALAGPVLTNTAATKVLGQATFTTNATADPPSPASLNKPAGIAVDPTTGKVFVADEQNHRILRFGSYTALANGANAEFVIGQLNYSGRTANRGGTPDASTLSAPKDLFLDAAGRLWVADSGNNRVLMYQAAATATGVPLYADRVFGQPDFTTVTAAATARKLANPSGVDIDASGVLWVADTGSHRVLGFKNAASVANGPDAEYVIGQTSYTAAVAGYGQRQLFSPTGVAADSLGRLWVADRDNNRVTMYANPPLVEGPPSLRVLGQKDYTANTPGATSATSLNHPTGVTVSGTSLWVNDDYNNRVLRYDNIAALTDGAAAKAVIGQSTFTGNFPGLTARTLALLDGHLTTDPTGSLWVADRLNNRVLRFPATNLAPTVTVNGRRSLRARRGVITLTGSASDDTGIARVSYQVGSRNYVRAQGTTSWRARIRLPEGSSRINVRSVDTTGLASAPVVVFATRGTPTPLRPIVSVNGSREITTTAETVTLTGTALDAVGIDRVSYQVGSNGYLRAKGRTSWTATIAVPKGRTQINIRSVNLDGLASGPAIVFVTRN